MGYLTMLLYKAAWEVTAVITPWWLYILHQGVMLASNIFQYQMRNHFLDIEESPIVYIYNSLTATKGSFEENLAKLDVVMT